jgi:Flp pilus assembly protein TadD/catechol 2,3-dioxygenase-like lactoylglutathione lyase family enzyme
MGLYSVELTSADVVDRQELFQQEFAEILSCAQITVLPPFPDYDLLGQSRAPKALLKAVNEVVLSRRPGQDAHHGWLLIPLVGDEQILGVVFAEQISGEWRDPGRLFLLERLARLCLERLWWEKRYSRDEETLLWRRQALLRELMRAIDLAERGEGPVHRRLLSDGPFPGHFSLSCIVVSPRPEPWAGAGSFWTQLGPRVAEALPEGAVAAHLGGGYLGVMRSEHTFRETDAWVRDFLAFLEDARQPLGGGGAPWKVAAGVVYFPDDFYEDGPAFPWQKAGASTSAPAEEVIRRATLAAETALQRGDTAIVTCQSLRQQGVIPRPGAAIRTRLFPVLADDEPCALLLVKLDDWASWQHLQGSREAAQRATQVLETIRGACPKDALVDWAGPERIAVYLPGLDSAGAEEHGNTIRGAVRAEPGTTVSIGMSVHPCAHLAKRDLLDNARKALVHTGFFGPDTQTLFDAVSLNISGDRLYESGCTREAVEELQRALLLDPDNTNVRNSLGVCYAQLGRLEEAVAEFSRVVSLDADDFMPLYNLGCALWNLGRDAEAERSLSRAAEREPENAGIWFQLAKVCTRQGRQEEALLHLRRATQLKPRWAQAWRLLGECLLEHGAEEEAMDAFKRALKISGKDPEALSGLALVYARTEANMEIALSLARRGVELEPDNPLVVRRLAELLWQNRELDEASVQCERAAVLAPEDEHVRRLREEITAARKAPTT